MPDYDLDDELHRLAASARTRVTPPSPTEIRMLGNRRHQRRVVMTTATAALAVVAASGVAIGATRTSSAPVPPATTVSPRPTTTLAPATPTVKPSPPAPSATSKPTTSSPASTELGPAVLITAEDVEGVFAEVDSDVRWRVVDTGTGGKSLTPCQPAPSAEPGREASVHRRLRQADLDASYPRSGLSHLIEQRVSEADAKAAYDRAVAWFTECDTRGVPGAKSTPRVFHERKLYGADEGRVIDVSTGVKLPSGEAEIITAAAVARVAQFVIVVTDDAYQQELSASREEVTALMAVAVAKLTGGTVARVPDSAMLRETDVPSVLDAKGVDTDGRALNGFTDRRLWCDDSGGDPQEQTPAQPTIVASRWVEHLDPRGNSVRQLTIQYDSEQAAGAAVKRLVPEASCGAEKLSLDAGDRAWAGRHTSGIVDYGAMIQVGKAVAFVTVHNNDTDIGEAKARAAFAAVEKRMAAAYR